VRIHGARRLAPAPVVVFDLQWHIENIASIVHVRVAITQSCEHWAQMFTVDVPPGSPISAKSLEGIS